MPLGCISSVCILHGEHVELVTYEDWCKCLKEHESTIMGSHGDKTALGRREAGVFLDADCSLYARYRVCGVIVPCSWFSRVFMGGPWKLPVVGNSADYGIRL